MFFLKKMFNLRDKANPSEEKPFLEHLEDLRVMVTRIGLTLLIATIICFAYKDDLMSIIRRPVEEVWVTKHEESLPKTDTIQITLEEWEKALGYATVADPLRQYDLQLGDQWWLAINEPKIRQLTEAAVIYRAVAKLPLESQETFLDQLTAEKTEVKALVQSLLESDPTTDLNAQGNLRLMSSLKPTETFMLSMKLAFFAGLIVSFPLILYFVLQFVLPGLKKEERKALWPSLLIGFGLFLGGVFFAYFYVLPNVLTFFYEWGQGMGISNDWRIGYYISFATTFVLIFGAAFELPVVVMALVKLGLLGHTMMRETRTYAVLAIFVIAAIITPTPDMMTLALLAVPMCILYEICIWLSYFHEKKTEKKEAAEEAARMERLLSNDPDDHHHDESSDFIDDDEDDDLLTEEDEVDDGDDYEDDDYLDYPGEHQEPDDDKKDS